MKLHFIKGHYYSNLINHTSLEDHMKKNSIRQSKSNGSLSRILSAMLVAALLVPVVAMCQTLQPVNLGSASNFAVLAGSAVSNIPTSAIKGDFGLSPAAGSGITGMTMSELTGTMYTVDATGPAGSVESATMLSAAKGDLTVAYNDAAGRTPIPTGPFLDPGSGELGGLTLVPGLYKFTSACSITGSDLTLSGSSTDVWIFQIASGLVVGTGVKVILAGGATAANIFWQVGTSATLGTTSVFKGTILADQSISFGSGAVLDGRALASVAAITLSSNAITRPDQVTAVENTHTAVAEEFALLQNYPNPFNPTTKIQYSLAQASQVSLKVYNAIGAEVATLVSGHQEAGNYTVPFGGTEATSGLSSGVYFYRFEAGSFVSIKKLMLIK
jgi:hypothetical protein